LTEFFVYTKKHPGFLQRENRDAFLMDMSVRVQ